MKTGSLKALKGKTIAVLGFASQGKAQAELLRKKGLKVIIGARKNHASWKNALKAGFKVYSFSEAAEKADLIHFLISDPVQKEIYYKFIEKKLIKGKTISFSSGFSIAFNLIKPKKNIDVIMIAPVAPGKKLLENSDSNKKIPGLIAVHQNSSGKAMQTTIALAEALNLKCFPSSFKEEAVANLFSEQFFLCGGITELGKAVFSEMISAGISKETAYLYSFNEINLLAELIHEYGIEGMYSRISDTAEFGSRINAYTLFGKEFKKKLSIKRKEISSGKFAEKWVKEFSSGKKLLKKMILKEKNSLPEKAFRQLMK
ncbi:MAG: ketol-acid reductoisomerase [Candidatus Diapherotrites archaeon]|nr:ketol-acid reductoisomerase [Candidatus Diapherotrites archaeon]